MPESQSSIKTKLKVVLKAGEVEVAESEDPQLWQQVLAAISAGSSAGNPHLGGSPTPPIASKAGHVTALGGTGPVAALATELGLAQELVIGAISPTTEAPYLNLDLHTWAAWARNIPPRGPGAVSATALAATLLTLWFRKANLGVSTVDQAQAALMTANVNGTNPARSIRNCRWLQLRGESQVVLNPARIADAIEVAKAFCSREKPALTE